MLWEHKGVFFDVGLSTAEQLASACWSLCNLDVVHCMVQSRTLKETLCILASFCRKTIWS